MRLRLRLVVMAIACLVAVAARAQQSCTTKRIDCNSHPTGRMEEAFCLFSNGGVFASYSFVGIAGQHIDVFMTSRAFRPRLYLYGPGGGNPVAVDRPATTITELEYDIPTTGTYELTATSENASAVSGSYQIDFYCLGVSCVPPFARVQAVATPGTVESGGTTTISVTADGTPPFTYTWFDDADPTTTIGFMATLVTPPLLRTTRFRVHVTNICGAFDSFATVQVTPPGPPTARRRPSKH